MEWNKFSDYPDPEIEKIAKEYFDLVKEDILNKSSVVLDIGCGNGRFLKYLAPKVKFIEGIDPSQSVLSASRNVKNHSNVRITRADVHNIPFPDESFDFVLSLGVFHHVPSVRSALASAVRKLKPHGHLLLYLYYNLDNRNILYRMFFIFSGFVRQLISRFPFPLKVICSNVIAFFVYLPFIALAAGIKKLFPGKKWHASVPLSYYIGKSFYTIRNDALDRFGTPLEKRFCRNDIQTMMTEAGLSKIKFSENPPFWHAIGKKL